MNKTFATEVSKMPYGKTKEEHAAYHKWWRSLNREHYNKKRWEWAQTFKDRRAKQARSSYLKNQFNLTLEQFDEMAKKQNYKCAICGNKNKGYVDSKSRKQAILYVDHSNETGKIRGLLCSNCNVGIGNLKHSIQLLKNAIEYLSH